MIKQKKKEEYEFGKKILEFLVSGKEARFGEWNLKEIEMLNEYELLTAKPVIYLLNLSEEDFIKKKNKWLSKNCRLVKKKINLERLLFHSALNLKKRLSK